MILEILDIKEFLTSWEAERGLDWSLRLDWLLRERIDLCLWILGEFLWLVEGRLGTSRLDLERGWWTVWG